MSNKMTYKEWLDHENIPKEERGSSFARQAYYDYLYGDEAPKDTPKGTLS